MSGSAGRSISHLQSWVKWLAVATMLVDHVGAILLPELLWLRVVGRVAFPAFAGLIAYNVAARGVPVMRYLPFMGVFAVVSQLPFMWAGFGGLNIFFTLGLGLVVWGVRTGQLPAWALVGLAVAPFVDYGVFGVLLLVAIAEYVVRGSIWLGVAVVLLVGLAQGSVAWGVLAIVACGMAYLAVGAGMVAVGRVPAVGRGSKFFFYWFYPVHLAGLVLLGTMV